MIVLRHATEQQMIDFGRQLLHNYQEGLSNFAEAAQIVANTLYDELRQPNGERLFGMVRLYRFGASEELPPELRHKVPVQVHYSLALMATIGLEPAWCDPFQSRSHHVLAADDPSTPMLEAVFNVTRLKFGNQINAHKETQHSANAEGGWADYFYVPKALGSRHIPDQENFVIPYQIESVIGVGNIFLGNTAYLCLGFSLFPMDNDDARKFARMSPFIATLLATYNEQHLIWN